MMQRLLRGAADGRAAAGPWRQSRLHRRVAAAKARQPGEGRAASVAGGSALRGRFAGCSAPGVRVASAAMHGGNPLVIHIPIPLLRRPEAPTQYTDLMAKLHRERVPAAEHRSHYDAAGLPLSDRQLQLLAAAPHDIAPEPVEAFSTALYPVLRRHGLNTSLQSCLPLVVHPPFPVEEFTWRARKYGIKVYNDVVARYKVKLVGKVCFKRTSNWSLRPPAVGLPDGRLLVLLRDYRFSTVTTSLLSKIDDLGVCVDLSQLRAALRASQKNLKFQLRTQRTAGFLQWLFAAETFADLPPGERAPMAMGKHQDKLLACLRSFEPSIAIAKKAEHKGHGALYVQCLVERLSRAMRDLPYATGAVTEGETRVVARLYKSVTRMPYHDNPSDEHREIILRYRGDITRLVAACDMHGIPGTISWLKSNLSAQPMTGCYWYWRRVHLDLLSETPKLNLGLQHDALVEQFRLLRPWFPLFPGSAKPARALLRDFIYKQVCGIMKGTLSPQAYTPDETPKFRYNNFRLRGKNFGALAQVESLTTRYVRLPHLGAITPQYLELLALQPTISRAETYRAADRLGTPYSFTFQSRQRKSDGRREKMYMLNYIEKVVEQLFVIAPEHKGWHFGPKEKEIRELFAAIGLTRFVSQEAAMTEPGFVAGVHAAVATLLQGEPVLEDDIRTLTVQVQQVAAKPFPPMGRVPYRRWLPPVLQKLSVDNKASLADIAEGLGLPGTESQLKYVGINKYNYSRKNIFEVWLADVCLQKVAPGKWRRAAEVMQAVRTLDLPLHVAVAPTAAVVTEAYEAICAVLAGQDPTTVSISQKSSRYRSSPPVYTESLSGERRFRRLPLAGPVAPAVTILLSTGRLQRFVVAQLLEEKGLPGCVYSQVTKQPMKSYGKELLVGWLDTVRLELEKPRLEWTLFLGTREEELSQVVKKLDIPNAADLSDAELTSVYRLLCRCQQGEKIPDEEMRVTSDGDPIVFAAKAWKGKVAPAPEMPWLGDYPAELLGIVREARSLMTSAMRLRPSRVSKAALHRELMARGFSLADSQVHELLADPNAPNTLTYKSFLLWLERSLRSRGDASRTYAGLGLPRKLLPSANQTLALLAFERFVASNRLQKPCPITPEELREALAAGGEKKLLRMPFVGSVPAPIASIRKWFDTPRFEEFWNDRVEIPGVPCSMEQLHEPVAFEDLETFKTWTREAVKLLKGASTVTLGLHEDTLLRVLRQCEADSVVLSKVEDSYFQLLYQLMCNAVSTGRVNSATVREIVNLKKATSSSGSLAIYRVLRSIKELGEDVLDEANAKLEVIARANGPTTFSSYDESADDDNDNHDLQKHIIRNVRNVFLKKADM